MKTHEETSKVKNEEWLKILCKERGEHIGKMMIQKMELEKKE